MQFSIIIPAKNEAANIGRCLDSISQIVWDRAQYEVIVVDNGSTDATADLARERGATVYVKPELTISGLRNFGAHNSSGNLLAFLDADCAVDKLWLNSASVYLNEYDGVTAFGSPAVVPDCGTWVQNTWFIIRGKPNLIIDVGWLESANLFVKRKAFDSVGGFNEDLVTCEDYDLTQRLKRIGRLVSDYRVRAIHYREPATVREFVRKEIWRGKNNYTGILTRKVDIAEIPSLLLPLIYGTFLLTVTLAGIFTLVVKRECLLVMLGLLVLWQFPILLVSIIKGTKAGLSTICQLYLLFNAYFLARSFSLMHKG